MISIPSQKVIKCEGKTKTFSDPYKEKGKGGEIQLGVHDDSCTAKLGTGIQIRGRGDDWEGTLRKVRRYNGTDINIKIWKVQRKD